MERLVTTAACTTAKGKTGANAYWPTPGVSDFFFELRCPLIICVIFLEDMPYDYTATCSASVKRTTFCGQSTCGIFR